MVKIGRVAFNKMDAVTFGVPAADALKEEVERIGGQRIFLMISGFERGNLRFLLRLFTIILVRR